MTDNIFPDQNQGDAGSAATSHVYQIARMVGSSETSIQDAIEVAVARAASTLRQMRWFKVVDTTGHIADGRVHHYQVTLDIGFTLEQP